MKRFLVLSLLLALSSIWSGCSTTARRLPGSFPEMDPHLTKEISDTLLRCQQIKPGMTRAELLKVFTIEGGMSTPSRQHFVLQSCPYVKVDVDFNTSDSLEELPTDTISKISMPYLQWSILD